MSTRQANVMPIKFVGTEKCHALGTLFHKGQMLLAESTPLAVIRVYGPFRRWHSDQQGTPLPRPDEGVVEKMAGHQKQFYYFEAIPPSEAEKVRAALNRQEKRESAAFSR